MNSTLKENLRIFRFVISWGNYAILVNTRRNKWKKRNWKRLTSFFISRNWYHNKDSNCGNIQWKKLRGKEIWWNFIIQSKEKKSKYINQNVNGTCKTYKNNKLFSCTTDAKIQKNCEVFLKIVVNGFWKFCLYRFGLDTAPGPKLIKTTNIEPFKN